MRARLRWRREIANESHYVAGLLLRVAMLAFVAVAIALAVNQSPRGGEIADVRSAVVQGDSLAPDLARCRTITPEQNAADESCRLAWASYRRRFFAPSVRRPDTETKAAIAAGPAKSQDRVPSADVRPDRDEVR